MTVVLDADVVIGALDAGDAHHQAARRHFSTWHADGRPRLLSAVNLSEVLIAPAGEPGQLVAAREAIAALGITIRAPSEAVAVDAARLRRRHPISLPDAYALATARRARAPLISFDRKVLRAAELEGLVA